MSTSSSAITATPNLHFEWIYYDDEVDKAVSMNEETQQSFSLTSFHNHVNVQCKEGFSNGVIHWKVRVVPNTKVNGSSIDIGVHSRPKRERRPCREFGFCYFSFGASLDLSTLKSPNPKHSFDRYITASCNDRYVCDKHTGKPPIMIGEAVPYDDTIDMVLDCEAKTLSISCKAWPQQTYTIDLPPEDACWWPHFKLHMAQTIEFVPV